MVEVEKKKVTLSLPVESNDKLEKMAQKKPAVSNSRLGVHSNSRLIAG
ncbi:hypothetical protein SC7_02944 [Enterococcus faecalis EnGen0115]|nr:hypothetical protein SC7_02944 [Enterococcus faecalis EnGen0115]